MVTNTFECTTIARGCSLKGCTFVGGDLVLDGFIEGEVECLQRLIIDSNGEINGTLKAKSLVISGKFSGEAIVSEKVYLKNGALVKGKITCSSIECEPNAELDIELNTEPLLEDYSQDQIVRTAW
jgi:cytoskeletal protein CcmA (bactofilin family)